MKRLILAISLVLLAANAWAAPTHHTTSTNSQSAVQTPSYTHTPGGAACPNSVAIIGVSWQDATGTLSSVTYNGQAATSLGAAVTCGGCGGNMSLQMFIYKNSGTGAVTVQANFSETMNAVAFDTRTYCNVDQTNSTGTRATGANGGSTTPSVTVTSAVGELVIDMGISGIRTVTVDGSQTQRSNFNAGGGNHMHFSSEEAGAASVVMGWTLSSASEWSMMGIPLKPARAGGAAPILLN